MAIARSGTGSGKVGVKGATSLTVTFTTTANNHLVVAGSLWDGGAGTHPSTVNVSDSSSTSWTVKSKWSANGNDATLGVAFVAYRENAPSITSTTVSLANGDVFYGSVALDQWTGVATSASFDTQTTADGTASSASWGSGSLTASNANCLIYGAAYADDSGPGSWNSVGAPWTEIFQEGDTSTTIASQAIFQIASGSTGPFSCTFNYPNMAGSGIAGASILVSFLPAGGAAAADESIVNRPLWLDDAPAQDDGVSPALLTNVSAVGDVGALNITASQAVPDFTQTATVTDPVAATASQTIPAFSQTATTTDPEALTATQAVPDFTQTATLSAPAAVTASQTVPAFSQTATLTDPAAVNANQTVPAFAQTATITDPLAVNANQTVPAFAQTATLTNGLQSNLTASQAVPDFAQTATITDPEAVSAAQVVPDFTQAATITDPAALTATQTVPAFDQAATISVPVSNAVANQVMPSFSLVATLTNEAPYVNPAIFGPGATKKQRAQAKPTYNPPKPVSARAPTLQPPVSQPVKPRELVSLMGDGEDEVIVMMLATLVAQGFFDGTAPR